MPSQGAPIDVNGTPDLLRVAEEVRRSTQPRAIARKGEPIAIITPSDPETPRGRSGTPRTRALTKDDSLFNIVGVAAGPDDGVTDVSSNKHEYLADTHTATPG
jgi:hypothetical protein